MSKAPKYSEMVYNIQCVINRSMLTLAEFSKLDEVEEENLMTAIEAINARKDTIARLVMAAKKRNGTFNHNDKYNLDTILEQSEKS